jgi:hypothetical protein
VSGAARFRVGFLTLDLESASARVRIRDHQDQLAELGVLSEVSALPRGHLARRRLFCSMSDLDAIVLHRVLLGETDMVSLRRAARALVLDMDDAVYVRPTGPAGGGLQRKFEVTLRASDLVICGNLHLRETLRSRHPRVRLLPPASPPPEVVPTPAVDTPVRLVWTGSEATLPYLERLAPALEPLGGSVLLEVLADGPPRLPASVPVSFTPWSLEAETTVLARAHIGLYPLDDEPWSLGKCAYKLHRYMQFGLPSVSSPHGGGREVLGDEEAGLLAESTQEWEAALRRLVGDPALRRRLGARARALALGKFALGDRTRSLARILREAASIGRLRGS